MRTLRGPVVFPLRAVRDGLRRPVPRAAADARAVPPGLRRPRAAAVRACRTRPLFWGATALVLTYSAYVAEVFRAGIESVHPSQRAAARSLGLTYGQTLRHVVLPQAVRRVVPAADERPRLAAEGLRPDRRARRHRRHPCGPDRDRARLQLHALRRGGRAVRRPDHPDDPVHRPPRAQAGHARRERARCEVAAIERAAGSRACASRSATTWCCATSTSTVERGQCVVLIGASGSGKSTLLRCVNLLEVVDDGAHHRSRATTSPTPGPTRMPCARGSASSSRRTTCSRT